MVFPPKLRSRVEEAPPLEVLYLTTEEIQEALSRRNAWNGHWLHGLCSAGSHRWRVFRTEIWYGADAAEAIAQGASEEQFPLRRHSKDLWQFLTENCDDMDFLDRASKP